MSWGKILLGLGLAGALIWALVMLVRSIDRHDAGQQRAGASAQSSADYAETLERTEQGNAARAEIRNPGSAARHEQCLRSARNPEVCQRFVPQ